MAWQNGQQTKPQMKTMLAQFATITGAVGKAQWSNSSTALFLKNCFGLVEKILWVSTCHFVFRRKIWIDDISEGIKGSSRSNELARSRWRFAVASNKAFLKITQRFPDADGKWDDTWLKPQATDYNDFHDRKPKISVGRGAYGRSHFRPLMNQFLSVATLE